MARIVQLARGNGLAPDALELIEKLRHGAVSHRRAYRGGRQPISRIGLRIEVAVRTICVSMLFTQVEEKPRLRPAPQNLVHYLEAVIIGVGAPDASIASHDVRLYGCRP